MCKKRVKNVPALFMVLALLWSAGVRAETILGTVAKVNDGDTLTLDSGVKIRLFGIDTPELHQQCKRGDVCYPCGAQARAKLAQLTKDNNLRCETRGKSYDRIVAQCFVGEADLSRVMLRDGLATTYRKFLKPKDSAYTSDEAKAMSEGKGIWASVFIPMEDWRRHGARLECER